MIQNRVIFVTGRKGSGKTSLANGLAQAAVRRGRRVLVLAPMQGFQLLGAPVLHGARELLDARHDKRSIVFEPVHDSDADAFLAYAYAAGNVTLYVDEVDLYCSPYNSNEALREIIRYGRHRRIDLVAISQRPANVARDLTAQADMIVVFNTLENRDLDYLAARLSPDMIERVRALPLFDYLVYSGGVELDKGDLT